jgi:hypothetical protein
MKQMRIKIKISSFKRINTTIIEFFVAKLIIFLKIIFKYKEYYKEKIILLYYFIKEYRIIVVIMRWIEWFNY